MHSNANDAPMSPPPSATSATPELLASAQAALLERLAGFPARRVSTRAGQIGYREAGASTAGTPLVLLHGIGSGAPSWLAQLEALGAAHRVLAWDAPGYGESAPLAAREPVAADYADALAAWLDALAIERVLLVGHSLGAVMAGAFARVAPQRVSGLLLCSPAAGYGAASAEQRAAKRDARLALLESLGPAGLAAQRSANLLAPHAEPGARAWVQWNMARIVPDGYRQATHLLAQADLAADLVDYAGPVEVVVGAADAITPPAACEPIAAAARVPLQRIEGAGHACYIETPSSLNALIEALSRRANASASASKS